MAFAITAPAKFGDVSCPYHAIRVVVCLLKTTLDIRGQLRPYAKRRADSVILCAVEAAKADLAAIEAHMTRWRSISFSAAVAAVKLIP